jgi:hypothetical protein
VSDTDQRGAIGFAERVLELLDEGRYTATYKYAVLLALVDVCLERTQASRIPPDVLTTRQLADKIVEIYPFSWRLGIGRTSRPRSLTPGVRRGWKRERGTSERWKPSPARVCSALLASEARRPRLLPNTPLTERSGYGFFSTLASRKSLTALKNCPLAFSYCIK